jgi:hypothetical protein
MVMPTEDSSMGMNNVPGHEAPMGDAYSLNLPMTRHGSGTAWLPDASSTNAVMMHSKGWMYMLHGSLFLRYRKEDLIN